MKIDVTELKKKLEDELEELEVRKKVIQDEKSQLEAVERIATRIEGRDTVDDALSQLKSPEDMLARRGLTANAAEQE